ncbi:hypothetical protein MMC08_004676 [Hypocenomyce scalaris]|nr:hypothetical protein [Hypocenomyce scalaris]
MVYESQISFTLDTICPWPTIPSQYTTPTNPIFQPALQEFSSSSPQSSAVNFTVKYLPYQLYPDASKEGEDKYEWYKKTRYDNSEEKMQMYTTLMSAYGVSAGIDYRFDGTIANTLDAHRLIQHYQEEKGAEVADKLVNSLYNLYFESAQHPSSAATLLTAANSAGIPEADAKAFVDDEYEGLQEVKMLIREQASNGVDSVPYIVVEGRRRDFTLEGAKEVAEYLKTLEQVAKESG